ncbi:MFS transporter [Rhodococcus sp. (in: high G+C Gram-positive bacteria)]|uniref:MFS transporter n=1 Tax=Rhodococcus sp. TaxID=1831 RepID=UPI00389007E2
MSALRAALPRAALYTGGFLGPFGGSVVVSMLPEMGADLGVTAATAATSVTAYLGVFAAAMLFSGTLGARWGRARTVRFAYFSYAVVSVAAALAPTLTVLLGARMLQGAANAFTTPLLLAALASLTPQNRLGRALGLFGALQAAGLTFAPLVGGLAAEIDWRWAFVVLAAAALALACIGLPGTVDDDTTSEPARLRDALRPRIVRIGIVALLGWGAIGGLNFLLAFRAEDVFALTPSERGALLTVLGFAGILTARRVGILVDRIGARRTVLIGSFAGAVLVVTVGTVTNLTIVAVAWFLAGVASQCVLVGVNAAVLGDPGANRGGAVSVVQAFRFGGGAFAPLALTPVYSADPTAAFLVPAVLLAVVTPLAIPASPRSDSSDKDGVRSS